MLGSLERLSDKVREQVRVQPGGPAAIRKQGIGLNRSFLQHSWGSVAWNITLLEHRQKWGINLNLCRWSLYLLLHYNFLGGEGCFGFAFLFVWGFFQQKHLQFFSGRIVQLPWHVYGLEDSCMDASKSAEQSGRKRATVPVGTPEDNMPLKGSCNTSLLGNACLMQPLNFIQIDLEHKVCDYFSSKMPSWAANTDCSVRITNPFLLSSGMEVFYTYRDKGFLHFHVSIHCELQFSSLWRNVCYIITLFSKQTGRQTLQQ